MDQLAPSVYDRQRDGHEQQLRESVGTTDMFQTDVTYVINKKNKNKMFQDSYYTRLIFLL
jgi:hypothetical protein